MFLEKTKQNKTNKQTKTKTKQNKTKQKQKKKQKQKQNKQTKKKHLSIIKIFKFACLKVRKLRHFQGIFCMQKKRGFDISIHTSENVSTMVIHNNTKKMTNIKAHCLLHIDDFIFSSKHTRELLWIKSAIPNALKSGNLPTFVNCGHLKKILLLPDLKFW